LLRCNSAINAVAFSPDSKLVVIGLDDATAKVYSTATF